MTQNNDLIRLSDLQKFPIRIDHYDRVNGSEEFVSGVESVIEYAENLPRVDAEPVRHGRWENTKASFHKKCSYCKSILHMPRKRNYCPNCGAKMDGELDEAN